MKSIGIRELKEHTGDVLRGVKDHNEPIQITDRGQAIAMIVPIHRESSPEEREAAIRSLDSLAAEIGKYAREKGDVASDISAARR